MENLSHGSISAPGFDAQDPSVPGMVKTVDGGTLIP